MKNYFYGLMVLVSTQSWVFAQTHSRILKQGTEGHGGGAFICKPTSKSQLLDLYEAEQPLENAGSFGGLHIIPVNLPYEQQVTIVLQRLNPKTALFKRISELYLTVSTSPRIAPKAGKALAWPSDAHNAYAPADCAQKGIISYHDDGNWMEVDEAAINSLPETQKAAAWVHETIYKFLRETQHATDSIRARQIVGLLFSNLDNVELTQRLLAYGMSLATQESHLDPQSGRFQVSYQGEPAQPLHYQLARFSGEDACKTVSQLNVNPSGDLFPNAAGDYPIATGENTQNNHYTDTLKNWDKLFDQHSLWRKKLHCVYRMTLTDALGNQSSRNYDETDTNTQWQNFSTTDNP